MCVHVVHKFLCPNIISLAPLTFNMLLCLYFLRHFANRKPLQALCGPCKALAKVFTLDNEGKQSILLDTAHLDEVSGYKPFQQFCTRYL